MIVSERLSVKNFFTIKEFDWEIKEFNILIGDMGSGKSICVKLLWFLEDLFMTLFLSPTFTKDDINSSVIYERISKRFGSIFFGNFDFSTTEIKYSYSCNGNKFDLQAIYDKHTNGLKWSSNYIDTRVKQWKELFATGKNKTGLNMSFFLTDLIYSSFSRDFHGSLPIRTMFIPAARAIASITDNTDFLDMFIVNFIKMCKRIVSQSKNLSDENVNKILHIKNIKRNDNNKLIITLPDEYEVSPSSLSSGQQELLYLMLILNNFKDDPFSPFLSSTRASIFIEEPEAHLFPQNQKDALEYIVEIFRLSKERNGKTKNKNDRFFITTHSPYVLNVISTMMNRGRLRHEKEKLGDKSFDSTYYLDKGEVSAYFINGRGEVNSMVSKDETYINAEGINHISNIIYDEANSVDDELAEIRARNRK